MFQRSNLLCHVSVADILSTFQRNVRIDESGRARLTEYGLAPITRNPTLTVSAIPAALEGPLAPELIGASSTPLVESKPADIFAFSMLALELLTSTPPFNGQPPAMAALLISQGVRPEFPQNAEDLGLTTRMRNFLHRCWDPDPMQRPTIDEVVDTLESKDINE